MKKTKTIIAKSLSLIMSAGILGTSLPVQAVHAATDIPKTQIQQSNIKKSVLYEDSTFKLTETDNSRIALNKKTHQKTVLTFTDPEHSEGIYKDIDGNEKKYFTDTDGNIYLDDECIVEVTHSDVPVKNDIFRNDILRSGYTNSDSFKGKDGFTYYYVDEITYNTKVTGDAESVALGILSFVPYVGPIFGLAGIIETVKNFGADTLYVVEDRYCTSDYSHYVYKNYFYSDRNHSNLVDSNVVYKKMW